MIRKIAAALGVISCLFGKHQYSAWFSYGGLTETRVCVRCMRQEIQVRPGAEEIQQESADLENQFRRHDDRKI